MTHYPLLFGYRRLVVGNGFVAGIEMSGRGLLAEEGPSDFWMYGVNPGSAAGSGKSQSEAVAAFRERVWSVLVDLASEAEDFQGFKAMAQSFFHASDAAEEERWLAAVKDVREGKIESDLPKKNADDFQPSIQVHLLELRPAVNPEPSLEEPNLAA